jgi:hypothetical protein
LVARTGLIARGPGSRLPPARPRPARREARAAARDVELDALHPVEHALVDRRGQAHAAAHRARHLVVQAGGGREQARAPVDLAGHGAAGVVLPAREVLAVHLEVLAHVADEVRQLEGDAERAKRSPRPARRGSGP